MLSQDTQNKPIIIWEKWVDPYGSNIDSVEWPGYDSESIIEDEDYDSDTNFSPKIKVQKFNGIFTQMGIIPYNEHTDCSKIFNFWIGHTNFNLSKDIISLIEKTHGVETLDIFTRYRFRVSFGKAFNDRNVMNNINQLISQVIS